MGGKRTFQLIAGHPALDLLNTVSWRLADAPEDRLRDHEDLLAWARQARLIDAKERKALRAAAERSPRRAREALERTRLLRELAYRLVEPLLDATEPRAADVEHLNDWIHQCGLRARVGWTGNGYSWLSAGRGDAHARLLDRLLESWLELLTSPELGRVARCQDDRGCGWVFLDRSPARRRRWCSMADCGNRAKARRHYRRQAGR